MSTLSQLIEKYGLDGVAPTHESATAINRRPSTLRKWSCLDNGPIRPVRINKFLAWRVSELQALVNGEVK